MDQAIDECVKKKLFSANDFSDVVEYLKRQRSLKPDSISQHPVHRPTKPLSEKDSSVLLARPSTRDPKEYEEVFKGAAV
ncbi:hypothetical protein ABDH65_12720 [Heyndrickxia ginsengihumi]|uniref:hypothetical protein n=1 Tax=Heyndrickxia ginsengihumi TaxID=363870 RepID=UPI003D1F61E3